MEITAPVMNAHLMDALCRAFPGGVAVLDTGLRYVYVNPALAASNGLPAAEHLGRSVREVLPQVAPRIEALMQQVLRSGESVLDEFVSGETPGPAGRRRSWLASYHPYVDPMGRQTGILAVVQDVTEQRDVDRQLHENEARLRRVLDSLFAFVGVLLPDGTLIDANRAPLEAAGIDLDDVVGRTFWECYWWNHDPEVQRRLHEAVQRCAAGEVLRYDAVIRAREDTRMTIDFMLAPLYDDTGRISHLIASGIDISSRVESERALRQSDERFRLAVEFSPDGMAMVDSTGRLHMVNGKMEALFGYGRDEFLGMTIEMLMPERYRARHPGLRASFFDQPSAREMARRRELYALRKDGSEFPVEIGLNPIGDSRRQLVLATIVDVTTRKAAQSLIERALAEKTALLGEVHHRVKNNLQVVSSLLSLQARNAPPAAQALLEESQGRVKAMALIHQLLYERHDFSEVDLGTYLERLAALLRESMLRDRRRIELRVECRQQVALDLQRAVPCGLLVTELVTNAIKHAFVDERAGRVHVLLDTDDQGQGRIVVSDDGVGLPAGLEFGQVRSLGFQLIPLLVDQLHGQLTLRRSPGTVFEVILLQQQRASS